MLKAFKIIGVVFTILVTLYLLKFTDLGKITVIPFQTVCKSIGMPQSCKEAKIWRCGVGWTGFQCFDYQECPEGSICISPAELQ